jgi:predicted SnoaL-like aldol condensation-catalyzing enzyme
MNSNKEKAIAALSSLQSGDSTTLENYLSSENYVQPNLDFPSGRDFIIGALPDFKKRGTRINIIRVIADADFVALHVDYNFFGE